MIGRCRAAIIFTAIVVLLDSLRYSKEINKTQPKHKRAGRAKAVRKESPSGAYVVRQGTTCFESP